MHQYISDTAFAARGLIDLIGSDFISLEKLQEQQRNALSKVKTFNLVFLQREMGIQANYWHGRLHEASVEHADIEKQIEYYEAQIRDKHHSLAALSGALLQIAKQGISSVHGQPDNSRPGRLVCGAELRWVIWAGRNQALHYEQPKMINEATEDLFARLNEHLATPLPDPKAKTNLSFEVVSILGWRDFARYEEDMISLLG